jgi:YidC/Oxa1 family membrane protein insertase
METKRWVLAIVLSFLIIFLYQLLFLKKAPQPQTLPGEGGKIGPVPGTTVTEKKPAEAPAPSPGHKPGVPARNIAAISAESEEHITVGTSLYQAVWSNRGGVLESWKLKRHKNEKKEDLDLVSAASSEAGVFPFSLMDEDRDPEKTGLEGMRSSLYNASLYKASPSALELKDGEKGELSFFYSDGKELEVEKKLTFYGGRYDFDVAVRITKGGQSIEPRLVWGPGIGNPSLEEQKQRFGPGGGVTVLASGNLYRIDEIKYKPEQSAFNFVTWAGYDDNYFAALFIEPPGGGTAAYLRESVENKRPYFYLAVTKPSRAFIGPKDFDHLTELGFEAKKIVRFGFFGFIAEILLWSIKFIHKFVPNWGFAIIVLTLIIKVLFFPLTYSSTKSMAKMAEIQPKIKALRAKYKKAKTDIAQRREMNEAMMRLYKEHGINPAGGCLPMLIQIPVFWGFFRLLVVAIEFRRSPWILWIRDLSVKDPYYVTPLLMGVTQFISQKMTPTAADPSQARMMLIMPVVMTLFFMNFQSGLVLYWLTSNVLQIGQQYIMNKLMKK